MAPTTPLLIQTAHLGDVVLTLPLIHRLAGIHGPVDVVTTPAAAPLVEPDPAVHQVIPFDKHGRDRGAAGLKRLAARLREAGYGRAYLAHPSLRSALLARRAGIPERIGFAAGPASWSYTRRIRRPRTGHESHRLLALAGPGGVAADGEWLPLTPADHAEADQWLRSNDLLSNDQQPMANGQWPTARSQRLTANGPPFIALAPGARWDTKRWPHFARLAAILPDRLVVVGGDAEVELGREILAAAPGRAWSAAGRLSLRGSAALIDRAAALVTNDSAPLHLAAARRRPIVALFGPTQPGFGFGPPDPADLVLQHPTLPCRPCSVHGGRLCPLIHHRCLREISPAAVAAALARRLGRT